MSKNCVFSVHIDNNKYSKLWGNIHKNNVKRYCAKYGIDFICLTQPIQKYKNLSDANPHYKYIYNRFYMSELLQKYDRCLYVDSDILFLENCENLFDIVPQDCIGYVKNMNLYSQDWNFEDINQNIEIYNKLYNTNIISKNIGKGINLFPSKYKNELKIENLKLDFLQQRKSLYGIQWDCPYLNYITSKYKSYELGIEYDFLYPHEYFGNNKYLNQLRTFAKSGKCKIIHIIALSPNDLSLMRYRYMKYFDDKFGIKL